MPAINELTIGITAVVAREERCMINAHTKTTLAVARA
jgi:hypothetical protein